MKIFVTCFLSAEGEGECRMTEERRIKFVGETVLGVEEMFKLFQKIYDTLVTNLETLSKLEVEFHLSEKYFTWEEGELAKTVLDNHQALMQKTLLLQAELASMTFNLLKFADVIDPTVKQNKPVQPVLAGLTSEMFKLALDLDPHSKP